MPIDHAAAYPALFAPYTLAGKRLKNRIVHASMTTRMGEKGRVTERQLRYYANRAIGGAAMIVTEPLSMARHQHIPYKIVTYNDDELDGLQRWAHAVESHDCRLLGQIQDPGRGRHEIGRNPEAVGASALPDDLSGTVPRPLTIDEIRRMNDDFAQSAARLKRCGFSGVEISAGHGHMFHQFLSPWSNARDDAYGGDLAGRTRLITEMIAAIRAACGRDFILGVKLPGDDGVPGGIGPTEAAAIAAHVTAGNAVDYVTFAQGSHARSLEMHVPDDHEPRAAYMPLFRRLRKAVHGLPLIALGRITDPAEADAILASGDAELVALGRALVTDPAWPLKAAQGRAHDIRYCVSCNNCWYVGAAFHQALACDNNPRVAQADEVDYWPQPVPTAAKKRVVIVGAGVAGMEAAWIAAARGHHVTVFSRSPEIGGKARLRAQLPGGEATSSIYDYQHTAAQRAGVRFELGATATVTGVLALKPDTVILATGATMVAPRWLPAHAHDLVTDLRIAIQGLLHLKARQPGAAVIYDMDQSEGTYASAERLRQLFERVVIVTPRDAIAAETSMVTHQAINRRLSAKGIEVMTLSEPHWTSEFENGNLEIVQVYTGEKTVIRNVAFFTYSTPRAPGIALAAPLRAAGIDVRLIGDCMAPRNVMAATAEGHTAGHAV
jgi:dimethylglycine catabolism A